MALLKKILLFAVLLQLICAVSPVRALTLEECVQLALKKNPDLQKQQLSVELAYEDVAEQKSVNYGKLDLVGSYTHYNLPHTLAPLTPASIAFGAADVPTTQDLFGTAVVYEVPLFTGFAQTRAVEAADLQREMAGATLKLSREQLIYNVRTLYVQILSLLAQEKAQASYVLSLQRLYDDITRELSLGRKARIDQLKAAADLKNARASKDRIGGNVRITKAALAALLDLDQIPELEEIDLSSESMEMVHEGFTDRFAGLQRLRAARLATEKNSKLVEKAQGSLYPQLLLNTSYGLNFGPNDSTNRYSGDWESQEVWQAGVYLKWNIFDFGGNRAKVGKARVLERRSRYEQLKTELELKRALQEAVTKINTAVTDYNSAREELTMTRETEAIELVRFEQGAADINDLLYAKARNQLALSRFTGAGYTYRAAWFYLEYLLENGEKR